MNTVKRFWALCLDTHMKLALYKYAIIIIIIRDLDQIQCFPGCGKLEQIYHDWRKEKYPSFINKTIYLMPLQLKINKWL